MTSRGAGTTTSQLRHWRPSETVFWWHSQSPRPTALDALAMASCAGLSRGMQSAGKFAGFFDWDAATRNARIAAQPSATTSPQAAASGDPRAPQAATKGSR